MLSSGDHRTLSRQILLILITQPWQGHYEVTAFITLNADKYLCSQIFDTQSGENIRTYRSDTEVKLDLAYK